MLLSWSTSIDLAERYQIFLNNCSKSSSEEEILFHNCTLSWFGPFCRFAFDYEPDLEFEHLVWNNLLYKDIRPSHSEVTCYEHLHCQTKVSCLDWREICDGKDDCLDGSDEDNCWQLEVNECMDNDYRCHNGQCIPVEFLRDGLLNPDCLDRTDEGRDTYSFVDCIFSVAFHCEEHKCRLGENDFPCGDGQCSNALYGCSNGRIGLLSNDFCSNATACFMKLYDVVNAEWCKNFCLALSCIKDNCPALYEVHFIPLLFGHVRFLYSNKNVIPGRFSLPDYVCYNKTLCIDFLPPTVFFNNLTCRHFNDSSLADTNLYKDLDVLVAHVKDQFRKCLIATDHIYYCNYSTMYQCENSSKCISKQRLLDGIRDCPFDDDENFSQSCSLPDIHQRFNCSSDGDEKCFALLVTYDRKENCKYGEDEISVSKQLTQKHISFQTICDGRTEILPVLIDGRNETDETQCHYWPCNNTYSRCDRFWLCKDGADEINCPYSSCSGLHHECVFPNDTSRVSCLPINRANNSVTDCLGATDERKGYQISSTQGAVRYYFYCWNDTKYIDVNALCNKIPDCPFNDDEIFCKKFGSLSRPLCYTITSSEFAVEKFLCDFGNSILLKTKTSTFFKLYNFPNYPFQITTKPIPPAPPILVKARLMQNNAIINVGSFNRWFCNRGIPIRTRVNSTTSVLSCLCPSSYYGDRCQYQNQRVSLTIQIRVTSGWRSIYTFLITLIDHERNIQSYDQVEYSPVRDCRGKFNLYLLYTSRPKNSSMNYSVQIDAYNQSSMKYRASWIFPLQFLFLPVHRLSVLLRVPTSNMEPIRKCWPSCIHGKCFQYVNDKKSSFCHCDPGWSGSQCHKKHTCLCASDSMCISNSICLCPYGRFGHRCHLVQLSCRSELCMNGGQCVSIVVRSLFRSEIKLMCICPEEYVGDRCQFRLKRTQIDISFHHKLPIPSSLLIHFIAIHNYKEHNRTSIMKKIAFDQYILTVYTSVWFNIAFAQMFDNYYLIILQEEMITLAQISTEIIPSHRCQSLRELFSDSFANQHLLKRIKYYHIPCREQHNLVCFYDDVHFCLCTLDRHTNCFEFDHNMSYNCGGYNYCENEGHCFQDNPKCPTSLTCGCRQCYFGSRCQISS
ncbi:unnamed protein product [Adineta steineri]|uniref:EGF-like domain-containing protein n=1 Tax=Adineta steineri TaxID=433720 RepID=A0A813VVT4_9BILA|nr:unnamed protein product [Adineta steineri]CAF3990440.1 unnamed protein product [Adineta steineri]